MVTLQENYLMIKKNSKYLLLPNTIKIVNPNLKLKALKINASLEIQEIEYIREVISLFVETCFLKTTDTFPLITTTRIQT